MAVQSTALWRAGPLGNNTNGGGYDPGISGAATDYSQQNSAQAAGVNGSATATTTFIDLTAASFTAAMIGNAMYITGGGSTTGWYFVTAYTNSTTVTLDRSPGTVTGATWKLGGRWADWFTNPCGASTPLAQGNTVYALGSGIPNPSSYTYDYSISAGLTLNIGYGNGVTFACDPATPNYKAAPDTTGGMPVTRFNFNGGGGTTPALANNETAIFLTDMWMVGSASNAAGDIMFQTQAYTTAVANGCVFDQLGQDIVFMSCDATFGYLSIVGGEAYSSSGGSGGGWAPFYTGNISSGGMTIVGCNIHNCVGNGLYLYTGQSGVVLIANTIIAFNSGDGVYTGSSLVVQFHGCTIDGNGGNGINNLASTIFMDSNIISNHTGGGKYGITASSSQVFTYRDFTTYYGNTNDIGPNVLGGYMPHDTHGGSNPYVSQSTQNYTLI